MTRIILAWLTASCCAHADIRVVDGDSIVMDGERIRISGLDCDELLFFDRSE